MINSTLIIGLGDAGRGDDAFGPRVLESLQRDAVLDPSVVVLEAAAIGMQLLPLLCVVQHVLVITTVHTGAAPGSLHRMEWQGCSDDLAPRLPAIRRHGIELLRSLHFWMDPVPDLVVLGVEGEQTSGPDLSALVALAVHPVAQRCVAELRSWGHPVAPVAPERVAV